MVKALGILLSISLLYCVTHRKIIVHVFYRLVIEGGTDGEAELKPPNDPELETFEHLFTADQEKPEGEYLIYVD